MDKRDASYWRERAEQAERDRGILAAKRSEDRCTIADLKAKLQDSPRS